MLKLFSKKVRFAELGFRTDVHSHILPGVDDGFGTLENAKEAVQMLGILGIERIVLTPHIFPELYPDNTPSFIKGKFESVETELGYMGMDFRIAGENMVYQGMDFSAGELLSFPNGSVLIEMSYAFPSVNIRDAIFQINVTGKTPVLAHPERYTYYSRSLAEIRSLVDLECKLQLNVLSLGGFYGKTAKEKAEAILESGLYSYIGTDLHSISQIEQLQSLTIDKKHVKAVEKLIANNEKLWN